MLKIIDSPTTEPYRGFIYGPTAIGKTTFAAQSIDPVIISLERGEGRVRDRRGKVLKKLDGVEDFDGVRAGIKALTSDKHDFKTLIIDSADWLERWAHAKIGEGKDIVRAKGGYGAGYRESERIHREIIDDLDMLQSKRGMNVILTAHAAIKQARDPNNDPYDTYDFKLHDFVGALWKEWAQFVFFANEVVYTKESDKGKIRAFGANERVAYTSRGPTHYAKNRFNLPKEMVFDLNFHDIVMELIQQGEKDRPIEDIIAECELIATRAPDDATKEMIKQTIERDKGSLNQMKMILDRLNKVEPTWKQQKA